MARVFPLFAFALVCGGCFSSPREAAPTSVPTQPATPQRSTPTQADPEPVVTKQRCVPVSGCNMFAGCARVDDLGNGQATMLAYEQHPNLEGQQFPLGSTCWLTPGGKECADSVAINLPCTATPSQQGPLQFDCVDDGKSCKGVRHPAAIPPRH